MRLTNWLKQFRALVAASAMLMPEFMFAQSAPVLTLEEANLLARQNYPALQQKELARLSSVLASSNLSGSLLPQVSLNAQATYQSDVTSVPIPFPGITVPTPDKDQYKLTADLSQVIYDGGVIKSQKKLQSLNAGIEQQKAEVELYQVRERVNQLFLGILLSDAQLKQAALVQEDIRSGIKRTEAQVANGVTFRSNLDVLNAQLLLSEQRKTEIAATRNGLVAALSILTGKDLASATFITPDPPMEFTAANINRPELTLYERQSASLEQQKKTLFARNMPKAGLFGQGGYGRPGINMLDNSFNWFYIAGIRLNWSLGGWYTYKKERQQLDISRRTVDLQQQSFLLNLNARLAQQREEVARLDQLTQSDRQIIALRRQIKQAASAQLENQVITANDYLREVNAEDQANQALILHLVQLIQAIITYLTIKGN
jgi:outer membrane protein TolC